MIYADCWRPISHPVVCHETRPQEIGATALRGLRSSTIAKLPDDRPVCGRRHALFQKSTIAKRAPTVISTVLQRLGGSIDGRIFVRRLDG